MSKAHHPKVNAKKEIDANLLGPCGFYCGYCLAYRNGICLGCRYQARKSETTGITPVFCDTLVCATEKGFERCSDCPEHPCDKYDPEKGIFSKIYIDYLKNDVRKC